MIHNLLSSLNEALPFSPPLLIGAVALLIVVPALWLNGRSRGTILFCVATGILAVGLIVGLSGIEAPTDPFTWGSLEDVAEDFVGPAVFRRREQITTAALVLGLGLLFIVYNLAFQEEPGERSRQILERDAVQNKA